MSWKIISLDFVWSTTANLISTTSQHKNYTMTEAKSARTRLYKAIEHDEHLTGRKNVSGGIETDRALLSDLVATMTVNPNSYLAPYYMLRNHDFGGGSFYLSSLDPLDELLANRGVEREFLDDELERLRIIFVNAAREFLSFIGKYTYPMGSSDRNVVLGHDEREQPDSDSPRRREREAGIENLNESATTTAEVYDALVRRARRKLALQASAGGRAQRISPLLAAVRSILLRWSDYRRRSGSGRDVLVYGRLA